MGLVAAQAQQQLAVFGGFHALRDDGSPKRGGQADDAFDDGQIARIPEHIAYEALIDLEHIGRQAPQIGERRIAGTKIVQREVHAKRLTPLNEA